MNFLKGWKTVIFGLLLAIAPAGLSYLAGIDWSHFLSPSFAFFISGVLTLLLRVVTTTAIGRKE